MGAAASVKLIYSEAMHWFQQYFEGLSYIQDFRELDKNGDGGITFDELQAWLKLKAKDNESWKVIVTNQSIFKIAHMFASKNNKTQGEFKTVAAISGLEAFKQFLIHLFVLSILWVHFKHADEWHEGNDVGNEKLTFDEFKMACRTFTSAQANETESDQKIQADFELLDADKSGTVEFLEVCTYCSNFMDANFAEQFITKSTRASKRQSFAMNPEEEALMVQRTAHHATGGTKAVSEIVKEMEKNERIAHFEEIKINTEVALGVF